MRKETVEVRMGNIVFALPNYIETHVAAKCMHLYTAVAASGQRVK